MEMEKLFCVQFYITNSKIVYYQFVVESNFELATQEVIDNLKNDNVFNYHHLRTFEVDRETADALLRCKKHL